MAERYHISLIGGGRLAESLIPALHEAGHSLVQLITRSPEGVPDDLKKVFQTVTSPGRDLAGGNDLILLCLPEKSIREWVPRLPEDAPVAHTSGTTSMQVFGKRQKNCGVLYPLQTFSRGRRLSFEAIPLCLEASDREMEKLLRNLADSLSRNVCFLSSTQREKLHMAAVFACNYVNYMYSLAEDVLASEGLERELLHELIRETAEKAIELGAAKTQTGPAVRGEETILYRHRELLSEGTPEEELYHLIGKMIYQRFNVTNDPSL